MPRRSRATPQVTMLHILAAIMAMAIILTFIINKFLNEIKSQREQNEGRCTMELNNLKYQLDHILRYKRKMDFLITEMQQESTVLKQSEKENASNYMKLKQLLEKCEAQTEYLTVECKDLKQMLINCESDFSKCSKTTG